MVTQVLLATTSLSLGILAFGCGIWLTIWCLNYSHPKEVRAAKMAGYFIIVMAIVSLAITSANLTKAMLYGDMGFRRGYDANERHRFDDMRHERVHHMNNPNSNEAKDLSGSTDN